MTVSKNRSQPDRGCRLVLVGAMVVSTSTLLHAADSVTRRGKPGVNGTLSATSREGVTIQRRGESIVVPTNEIERITFDDEPPALQLGRGAEQSGNLAVALRRYEEALAALANPRPVLKADVEFFLARCRAKLAMDDPRKLPEAVAAIEAFRSAYLTSYHYYPLHEWLGKVYAQQGDIAKARTAFAELAKAPWRDFQWRAQLAEGRLLMDTGDLTGALERFDRVLADDAATPSEKLLQQQARLAKGQCLTAQGTFEKAEAIFREIIDQTPADEAPVQAAAHNALGDLLREAGKPKDALLAYLYVDLLVPTEQSEHAKALYYIAQLFGELGQADRAKEARERLRSSYPNSPWASKGQQ